MTPKTVAAGDGVRKHVIDVISAGGAADCGAVERGRPGE